MARDDFTQKVKDELAKQVAHRCSNPEHRIITIGPSERDKSNSIGEAAHICAASEGGPRYDRSMTREERKSIENGIWLYANCAKDIDRDVQRFTVESLKQWKASAITIARAELGKQLPSDTETINTLTTALSGNVTDLRVRAVTNVHAAVEQALQNLDPRFSVESSRVNGETRVGISANEDVSLTLEIGGITGDEFQDRYQSVLDHGCKVKISTDHIRITGSRLFETISKEAAAFTFSGNKMEAKQKLLFISPDKSRHEAFDDIDGFLVGGAKSASFSGSSCAGLFTFAYRIERGVQGDTQFQMNLKLEQWDGKLISDLPYFEKVFGFFKRLSDGWSLFATLEVDGNAVLEGEGSPITQTPETKNLVSFLDYTNRARAVASALKLEIAFTSTAVFNQQQYCDLADAADLFNAPFVTEDREVSFSCTIRADENAQNIRLFLEADPQQSVLKLPEKNSKVNIFGDEVDLPTKTILVEKVKANVQGDLETIKEGDLVTIDWIPVDGFKVTISFEEQDARVQ